MTSVDHIFQDILTLCQVPSPTGYTDQGIQWIENQLRDMGYQPYRTVKGVLFCELSLTPSPAKPEDDALLLSAHVDTLGLMVQKIKSNGHLKVTTLGGFPLNYVETENVQVITSDGRLLDGTVHLVNDSVHANHDTATTQRDSDHVEVILDYPTRSSEETRALGVRPGDIIILESRARLSGDGYLKSRHLDDKASCAILLDLARSVAHGDLKPGGKMYLAFTNYEEVGHGAAAGHPQGITHMLAVDMGVVGDDLDTNEHTLSICAKDSSGPYHYGFTHDLVQRAEQLKLAYAIDVYPFYGSDASCAMKAGWDYRHALIGTGVAHSHGYERIHRDGVAATLALLEDLVQKPPKYFQ